LRRRSSLIPERTRFSAIWPVFQAGLSNGLANAFNGLSVVLAGLDGFTDKRQFPARTNARGVKNGQFFRIKAGNWPV
jgi:hypothetical protein